MEAIKIIEDIEKERLSENVEVELKDIEYWKLLAHDGTMLLLKSGKTELTKNNVEQFDNLLKNNKQN